MMLKQRWCTDDFLHLFVWIHGHLQFNPWVNTVGMSLSVCPHTAVSCDWTRKMTPSSSILWPSLLLQNISQINQQAFVKPNPLSSCLCNHMKRHHLDQWCVTVTISPYLCLLHPVRLICINPSQTKQSQHPAPDIDKWIVSRRAIKVECCGGCVVHNRKAKYVILKLDLPIKSDFNPVWPRFWWCFAMLSWWCENYVCVTLGVEIRFVWLLMSKSSLELFWASYSGHPSVQLCSYQC